MSRIIRKLSLFLCVGILFAGSSSNTWASKAKSTVSENSVSENSAIAYLDSELDLEAGSVLVNEANFPDSGFRQYLLNLDDYTNAAPKNVLSPQEISQLSWINIDSSAYNISSLKGIEYLTQASYLSCSDQYLTELDLSKNTKLKTVDCSSNQIRTLDFSNNTELTTIYCYSNALTSLDVTKNTKLETLSCLSNALESLDVTNNPYLTGLWCDYNKLSAIDLSKNTMLKQLSVDGNMLRKLDVTNNRYLTNISCCWTAVLCLNLDNCIKTPTASLFGEVAVLERNINIQSWEGFDISRIVELDGIELRGNKFYVTGDVCGTYKYDCGKGLYLEVTIYPNSVGSDEMKLIKEFVSRMYTQALGRAAESEGLADWARQLESGTADGAALARGFIGSEEFKNRNLSDEAYVDTLYNTFFDRDADAGGKTNWLQALSSGASRESVLAGFINSKEFATLCDKFHIARGTMEADGSSIYNKGVRLFVFRNYQRALGRYGETEGVEYWSYRINTGQMSALDVAQSFFHSEEFMNKNTTNEQFVEILYETFLDRASDASGKADWVSQLNAGKDRDEVMRGFAYSQEFANIMAQYGL